MEKDMERAVAAAMEEDAEWEAAKPPPPANVGPAAAAAAPGLGAAAWDSSRFPDSDDFPEPGIGSPRGYWSPPPPAGAARLHTRSPVPLSPFRLDHPSRPG